MKILLFGKNGQLGYELQQTLAPLGKLIALDRNGKNNYCGNLENLSGIAETIDAISPDIIVNAAAYTAVDAAESASLKANLINAQAPEVMAREAEKIGSWFIHYSTDYVHDGSGKRGWKESDPVDPVNEYGRSKLAGEQAICASSSRYIILRTSWVYSSHGKNFAKTMLRLGMEQDKLQIINDQVGVPSSAEFIASVTTQILSQLISGSQEKDKQAALAGIYNLVPTGQTSWYQYACFVLEQARINGENIRVQNIEPITTNEYPTPAKRPLNSRLDTQKIVDTFGLILPPWQQGVVKMLQNISGDNQ